ncbi:AMIN domain-containing protein [Corynebacterium sp. ACRPQ]|uniref:AMIN domain-containing protein n=1 Tax=Corynebacterium sp. ACRPQ TaxID=2918201 RepID=UPI001EF261A1|nr:AMIN domain-containing protein [Corynebacterium sp. ACRPQ]MCG7440858.1 AMIN domain-containing protein [Corynebacterium sp. ACRPQ]
MSPSIFSRTIAVAISAGCALALAACSDKDTTKAGAPAFSEVQSATDTAEVQTSSATPAATSAPRSTSAADAEKQKLPQDSAPLAFAGMGTASLEDQQHMPESLGNLIPTGVRVGAHDGFTRVVIDLEGEGEPGWFTTYTDSPAQQASGKSVEVQGNTFLNLGIEGTPWPSTPELKEKYMQPGTTPGAGVVSAVNYTTTFEAQTQLIIGLEKKTAYSVTYLKDPSRVVIDFQN